MSPGCGTAGLVRVEQRRPQDVAAPGSGSGRGPGKCLSRLAATMPSSEGEVTTTQVTTDEQRDTASRLQDTTMAQVAPEVVIGRSPARINPKRKPDKSKIFRIRTSKYQSGSVAAREWLRQ